MTEISIFEEMQNHISKAMKEGEDSFVELIQSEIHECDKKKNNNLIFFITPDKKLKVISNQTSPFMMPISKKYIVACGVDLSLLRQDEPT